MYFRDLRTLSGFLLNICKYVLYWYKYSSFSHEETRMYFARDKPTLIIPNLLLGNHFHAGSVASLKENGVDHIMSVGYPNVANPFTDPVKTRLEVDVLDEDTAAISDLFDALTDHLHGNLTREETTLVHCHLGRSRSTTVVIAYLMRFKGMTADDALRYVRKKRPMAEPNRGFMKQLREYEAECWRINSA